MKKVDGVAVEVLLGEGGVIRHELTPILWAPDSKGAEGILVVGIPEVTG